jgi:hypothetical protein
MCFPPNNLPTAVNPNVNYAELVSQHNRAQFFKCYLSGCCLLDKIKCIEIEQIIYLNGVFHCIHSISLFYSYDRQNPGRYCNF